MERKIDYKSLDIKEIIKLYLVKDKQAVEEFWNRYSERIYNFPMKIYKTDEDTAGDFFTYVFERLKDGKKFSSFDMQQNFDTWFYIVLRNFLFSMLRGKKEVITVDINTKDSEGKELVTVETIADQKNKTYYQTLEEKQHIENIYKILNGLKDEYAIIVKLQLLYYLDLSEEDVELIAEASDKKTLEILKKIDNIRKELEEKSRSISMKEAQIGKVFSIKQELALKLGRLKRQEKEGKDVRLKLEEIERKLNKRQAQYERIIEEKEKGMYIVKTPHKQIGELLGITENAVSIRIHRAEKVLKEKILEEGLI